MISDRAGNRVDRGEPAEPRIAAEPFAPVVRTGKSAVVTFSSISFRTLQIDLNHLARAAKKVEHIDDVPH